jgi:hypothetical protein
VNGHRHVPDHLGFAEKREIHVSMGMRTVDTSDVAHVLLYFDALFVKTRQEGPVMTKAIYLALGINLEGEKELLGLCVAQTEGSKFRLTVFNELKGRGYFFQSDPFLAAFRPLLCYSLGYMIW